MPNEILVSYFQEWTQKGYSVEQLKEELLRQGYPKKDIEEAASNFGGSVTSPPEPKKYTSTPAPRSSESDIRQVSDAGSIETKISRIDPGAEHDNFQTGTHDFYLLGAKAGAIAGAVQGIIGAIIGTVLSTFVFSTLMAASGGIFGLSGGLAGDFIIVALIVSIIGGIISGAIGGAIIGLILAFLWERIPGETPFLKSFILSIILLILIGVLPSLFVVNADLLFAGVTLSLVTGVIGAAVYASLFGRFIKKPLF